MQRYIRRRFLIALAVVLSLLTAGYVTVRLMVDPEVIRQRAVATLSQMLGVKVTVEDASFDPLTGLSLDDLTIFTKDEAGRDKVLLRVPRATLRHRPLALLGGEVRYSEIRVRDAQIFLERGKDGTYNIEQVLESLRRQEHTDGPYPTIVLDGVNFNYTDHLLTDGADRPLQAALSKVSGSIAPTAPGSRTFTGNLSVNDPELGRWTIRNATIDTEAGTIAFKTKSSTIELDDELMRLMTGRAQRICEAFSPHGGTVRLAIAFRYDGRADVPLDFDVHVEVEGATASYGRFPYEVTDLHGTLVLRREGVEVKSLKGRAGPGHVSIQGTVGGYRPEASVAIRIDAENVPLDRKLRAAFNEDRRKIWDDLGPRGRANLACRLDRPSGPDKPTRVRVLTTNTPGELTRTIYRSFPYHMDLEGWAFYDAGVVRIIERPDSTELLEGFSPGLLLARHRDMVVEMRGGVEHGEPNRLVHLDLRLREPHRLRLDEDLKQALPASMRQVWDYLDLAGSTMATCRVERTDTNETALDVAVELTDIKTLIRCRDFPYEIRDPEGSVFYERRAGRFPRGRLVVRNLNTRRGETSITINGQITGFSDCDPVEQMDLNIRLANLPLDAEVRQTVSKTYRNLWDYLSPTPESRVNVDCRVTRGRPGMDRADFLLKIQSLDSSIMCADFPYRVEHVQGTAEYERNERFPTGRLTLSEMRCTGENYRINLAGEFVGFEADKRINSVDLIVEGVEVPLDGKLRAALAKKYRRTFDAFHPEGVVDVVCHVKRASRHQDLEAHITILPLGSSICYDGFPLRITDVAGRIDLADGVVKVSKMRGRAAGGIVTLDGVVQRNGDGAGPNFGVTGTDIVLGREIELAIPQRYRAFWQDLDPRGRVTLRGTLRRKRTEHDENATEFSGVILPENVALRMGLPIRNVTGGIRLHGVATKKGYDFRGRGDLKTVSVAGTRFRQVRGSFEKHDSFFNVYEAKGKIHGGEITAQMRVDLDDPITYGLVADAKGLHLNEVLRRMFKLKDDNLRGQLSGRLMMQGQGPDTSNLVGKANLQVREGKLWEVPLVLSLLKVFNLSYPERTAFTDAVVAFEFYDRTVHVKRANLIGNAFSIYGNGVVKPNGDVRLSFSTGWGRLVLPEVPLISPVVRGIQRQLVSVEITGTLSNPKLEVVPLVPVTAPMKGLLDGILTSERPAKEPPK